MFSPHLRRHLARASRAAPARWSSTSAPSPSTFWRNFRLFAGATTLASTSYYLGALYPPEFAHLLSPRTAPPPLHPEDPAALTHTAELEDAIRRLPVLEAHRARTKQDEWYETRPYLNLPEERRVNSLTAGTLKGPGKLAIPPLVRARHDATENWVFIHVGRALCGHEGVIHGGLLATLLDETLARVVSVHIFVSSSLHSRDAWRLHMCAHIYCRRRGCAFLRCTLMRAHTQVASFFEARCYNRRSSLRTPCSRVSCFVARRCRI